MVVRDDLSFLQLHKVIQAAMGWEDCHMHQFELASPRLVIGTRSKDDPFFARSSGLRRLAGLTIAPTPMGSRHRQEKPLILINPGASGLSSYSTPSLLQHVLPSRLKPDGA